MQQGNSLKELTRRFEQLIVLQDMNSVFVSKEERRHIADKYKQKTLQELNEIAKNLPLTDIKG